MVRDAQQKRGKWPAIMLAVLVHLAILVVLVFGLSWQNKEPPPVQVELWGKLPEPKVAEATPPVQEAKPEPKVEEPPPPPPKEEAKPPPVKEPEPEPEPVLPKPDLALKEKQEKERKAKEQKEQADKVAKEKETKEKEAKEKARKEQETQAQKQKQEQLAQEKAQQEEQNKLAAAQQAAQQAASDKAAAEKAAQQSAMNSYIAKIRDKIRNNTDVPDGVPVGSRLVVKLVVLPTGEVLSAEPVGGSGNRPYNDAVQRGIKRAEPLPLPDDPKLRQLFRSFDLVLTHEK
jgi:colicin import membrane protein